MSADLHIHICKNKEEENAVELWLQHEFTINDREKMAYGYALLKIDGKWIAFKDWSGGGEVEERKEVIIESLTKDIEKLVLNTDNIWIGEVSWLKAGLFDDDNSYIPETIDVISKLIDGLIPITKELVEQVDKAFNLPNKTKREGGVWLGEGYALNEKSKVINFLNNNLGKKCFTISW